MSIFFHGDDYDDFYDVENYDSPIGAPCHDDYTKAVIVDSYLHNEPKDILTGLTPKQRAHINKLIANYRKQNSQK